jgi:cysteine desulfurase
MESTSNIVCDKNTVLGSKRSEFVTYLDYQATTPCDERVVEKMLPYFSERFGNPHSKNHSFGWRASDAVELARQQVASIIGAETKDIVFTSGATESNNLAIQGVCKMLLPAGKNHIITSTIEHKCVLEACRNLQHDYGFKVTSIGVGKDGIVNPNDIKNAITDKTAIVSIMSANNEIGTIQPIKEIGQICRNAGVFFHTDAAQSIGNAPINVDDMFIDLMSISGHKLYGPQGIGVLYVRRNAPRVRLKSLFNGGGQESGMRPGTLPTALCVGIGEACEIAMIELDANIKHIASIRDYIKNRIETELTEVYINGSIAHRLPGNLNISFSCVEGEALMMGMKDFALSSGSACTSDSLDPSYVLKAIGVSEELAHTSLRLSIGRHTTHDDAVRFCDRLAYEVNRLRYMSPLWDMLQAGVDLSAIEWVGH